MRHPNGRSFAIGRIVAVMLLALAIATPASAQFGALKKKLKGDAAAKAAEKAGDSAGGDASTATGGPAAAPATPATAAATGGTLVMTPEVVDRLVAGLKAGKAEREAAKKEDTPYGRYIRAVAAYEIAKSKCDAAQETLPTRMAGNEKMLTKFQHLSEKLAEAQSRQDTAAARVYADSSMGMVDPSCLVKQPEQPNDYWDAQRAIDTRAEQASVKAADFSSAQELGYASDRAIAILEGQAADASPSEKSAVSAKDPELKSLLGIREAQEGRISKQGKAAVADSVRPAPAPAPAAPAVPAGAVAVNECMMKNVEAHQAEIEALGNRGDAAQKAGNTALMMAIADTIQRIQFAGCNGAR
jgi:hypothetical protein